VKLFGCLSSDEVNPNKRWKNQMFEQSCRVYVDLCLCEVAGGGSVVGLY